jgi:2-amino-4-hydroxy-6-hydroxymethyldihydropteridine diphosphokinase
MVYFLGLGGNLGRRRDNLARARRLLAEGGVDIVKASSVYETEPVDFPDQPWFLNQVVEVRTDLDPPALLRLAQSIEKALGRVPTVTKGPRTIDIDILLADNLTVEMPGLDIPHPRLAGRNFVLVPLAEIAPELVHPLLGKSMRTLATESVDRSLVLPFGRRRR